jgi:putative phosphoesterase
LSKIWIISDTHLRSGQNLPASFTSQVNREDLIIHLGDFISLHVVQHLESLAGLEAVSGNCDPAEIRDIFPSRKIIQLGGLEIGLIHGRGGAQSTLGMVRREFEGRVDMALFGHTHDPYHGKFGRTVFFNPGSLVEGRGNSRSYGILRREGSDVWGEICEI